MKNKKGFILMELIIVLVIIVLLLAILIPIVTKYIDQAKENSELSEIRAVKVAIQTMINEDYLDEDIDDMVIFVGHDNYGLSKDGKEEVERLLKMDVGYVDNIHLGKDHILTEFDYVTVKGSKISYEDGDYTTEYIY